MKIKETIERMINEAVRDLSALFSKSFINENKLIHKKALHCEKCNAFYLV